MRNYAKLLAGIVAEPTAATCVSEPLLLNAVRGKEVERPPVWLMRQAGRYMKAGLSLLESLFLQQFCFLQSTDSVSVCDFRGLL